MANRFQPGISFKSVNDLLDFIPEEELKIVEALRELILGQIEGVKEKLSYNVPFYSRYKTICFIWPGSVPWGGTREGVQLGFNQGHLLPDDGYLNKGTRKTVHIRTFKSVKELDYSRIRQLLLEAEMVDSSFRKAK